MYMNVEQRAPHDEAPPSDQPPPSLFDSFWMGGFESACQINSQGVRIDMLASTQHDVRVYEDYQLVRSVNIRTVRDGVRWPSVETSPGYYDWSSFLPMVRAAEESGIQVIWNLLHYGWPPDLDILSGSFVDRFARYCRAVSQLVKNETSRPRFYVPANEISFLAWAIGTRGIIQPVMFGRADEVKRQLIRASIAAMEAIWEVDPAARFAHVDPIINVIAPRDRPDLAEHAAIQHNYQYEAWDLISGRAEPELGGDPKYLNVVGVNYYHANQWETPENRLRWEDEPRDERWVPFHRMLHAVHQRYHVPLFIAETSHFGVGRAKWIDEVAHELRTARMQGIPVEGACLYPIIDRPDWDNPQHWHNSGLWDMRETAGGRLERVACTEYVDALIRSQRLLNDAISS